MLAGGGYYWYRNYYEPQGGRAKKEATQAGGWVSVDSADARIGESAIEKIKGRSGASYTNLTAEQAVAYLLYESGGYFNKSYGNIAAKITGDTLHAKALVSIEDFGGPSVLGPLSAMLNATDTLQLAGIVGLVSPGLGEFRVVEARIHGMKVPGGVIPKLIKQFRDYTPEGLSPDGLPIPLPPYIEDIRIANGKITLYKRVE